MTFLDDVRKGAGVAQAAVEVDLAMGGRTDVAAARYAYDRALIRATLTLASERVRPDTKHVPDQFRAGQANAADFLLTLKESL